MRARTVLGFLLLTAFDTFAQVSLKLGADAAQPFAWDTAWIVRVLLGPWAYGAIAGYAGAFVVWMGLLRTVPVGRAFAASHLDLVAVLVVSAWLFGETITPVRAAGAVLILIGVCWLGWAESDASADAAGTA